MGRLVPAGAGMSRSVLERNVLAGRRSWWVMLSGFVEPVLYLFSLGDGRSVSYPVFVAPALLAAPAMNGAVYDSTFTVFWKLKYGKIYDAMLATPLGPRDVALGEVAWAQLRGAGYAAMFLFSATFYPLSTYPEALQWVVRATPLYLAGLGLVGMLVAARRIERLLLV